MRIWDSEPMTYFLWFYILKTNPEYTDSQLLFSFNSRYRNTDILLLSRSLNSRILRPLIVIHHWWTSCRPWDHDWGFRPLLHIIIKQLRHSNLFSSLQIPSSSWLMSNPSSLIFFIYGSSAELRSSLDYGVSLQLRPSHLIHSIPCPCLPGGRLHVAERLLLGDV